MTMAVASTRFAAVPVRAESTVTRTGSMLSMAAPLSCTFSELSLSRKTGANFAIIARASEVSSEYTFGETETEEAAPAPAPAVQVGTKLYVGNLPWSVDSAQLAEICQEFGTVEEVEVIYDQDSGRSRGFAFVTMESVEDAQNVIDNLNEKDMNGRALRVNFPQEKPRYERGARPERSFERSERPARGSRRPDDPNKLFVGNLPWGCDEGGLQQLFSDFGKVLDAKVVHDRDSGKSRGFGFVTLDSEQNVSQAIENLDGAEFDGRLLRVNLAGDKPERRF